MSRYSRSKIIALPDDCTQEEYELAVHLVSIGSYLYQIRNRNGFTQIEFAQFLEMPQCRLSQIECGAVDLKLSTLLKIAAILKISPKRLIPSKRQLAHAAWCAGGWGVKRPGRGRLV